MSNQPQIDSAELNGANGAPQAATEAGATEIAHTPMAPRAAVPQVHANVTDEGVEFGVLRKVPMTVQVEVGRTVMTLGEILDDLEVGTSIRLDRHAGDPVEVYVNGTLFARAEVVVVQDQIGAKIIELVDPGRALRSSGLR
ncbi:MAG TPA: FliM/FliN family flagellar motor switch protein [Candidatus Binataceae bacterium]